MPSGGELDALKANDFTRTVLLAADAPLLPKGGPFRPARIAEYRPNRLRIDLAGGDRGFLVLLDVWFPGWTCRIDGVEVPVYRANHAFRAVAIPSGAKEAVFTFEPWSYRVGWWVSACSLGLLALAGALGEERGLHSAGEAARRWLDELRNVRLKITGDDLLDAGLGAGPDIGRRLQAVLEMRLDGTVGDSADAQLEAALRASS